MFQQILSLGEAWRVARMDYQEKEQRVLPQVNTSPTFAGRFMSCATSMTRELSNGSPRWIMASPITPSRCSAVAMAKRRLDQALNTKEFAVLAGVSYSCARTWFRQPGFPAISGVVFWPDFVQWRNAKTGLQNVNEVVSRSMERQHSSAAKPTMLFTGKAAQLLAGRSLAAIRHDQRE